MARSLEPKKIKSAHRALEVFEYFNIHRQDATVMDIARAMGCPQSSTSELLSCLVALGYLHRDRFTRTYRPTARVALLGAWVQPRLFRQGHLLPMMDELAEATGSAVMLAAKMNTAIQYIHVVGAREGAIQPPAENTTASLLHSALGKVLLSTHDREQLRPFIHRLNAETQDSALRVNYATYVEELDAIRMRRYAANYSEAGGAILGILLPRSCTGTSVDEQIALGIFATPAFIRQNEEKLVRMLRTAVARRFGAVRVVAQPAMPAVQQTDPPRQAVG
jgi:DNA-binding IclR family transcriptional regulator